MDISNIPRYLYAIKLSFRLFLLPSIIWNSLAYSQTITLYYIIYFEKFYLHYTLHHFKGSDETNSEFYIFIVFKVGDFKLIIYY